MKKFFTENFGLIESIVCIIFGVVIVVTDICNPPVIITTLVMGGLIAVVGIIGLILAVTSKNKD